MGSMIEVNMYSRISEVLQRQAQSLPDKIAFKYLINQEEVDSFTYSELDLEARKIAIALREHGLRENDRALMVYPPGLEFIAAFFGCLYAGIIAVPAVPPNKHIERLHAIVQDCQPAIVLSKGKLRNVIHQRHAQDSLVRDVPWLATDESLDAMAKEAVAIQEEAGVALGEQHEKIAFLQYTSGSTGNPKGVIVTHQNLIHNLTMIQQAAGNQADSVMVNWLPLYHDMGIIGGILQPLFVGATCYVMSPLEFLQNPFNWLQAISKYKGTYSGAPNFAYDLCCQKVTDEELQTLDLSSWEVAFNGSDFVRSSTLHNFSERFRSTGFRGESLCPTYGLAEATLLVAVDLPGNLTKFSNESEDGVTEMNADYSLEEHDSIKVSCGRPHLDVNVKIVNPTSMVECSELQVGEIWISGPSVAQGYWNNDQATQETFQGYTAEGQGPFLRTGDLGYLKNGELYFKERMKDVIIIRGKNHYPQDIEFTVENSHYSIINFATAAISVNVDGNEKLVIVAEIYRKIAEIVNLDQLSKEIRAAVVEVHEIQVHSIVFLKEGRIPKTSSGKVQRNKCKQFYLLQKFQDDELLHPNMA